ncbi:MAG: hypothetical protein U1F43_28085 [Myxococcota bacterium]
MNDAPRPLLVPRSPPRTREEPAPAALSSGRAPPRVPQPRHSHAPVVARPEPPPSPDVASRALDLVLKPAAKALARIMEPLH